MKLVPVVKCKHLEESLSFYISILGFERKHPDTNHTGPVVHLINGEAELQLSVLSGDGVFGCAINVLVDEVDELFQSLVRRGLRTSKKSHSPVHQGPVDQTWGMREFYVEDPNGNTLRFTTPIK